MSIRSQRLTDTQLRERFRPVFERIRQNTVARELNRTLLHEEVGWLREQRFGALRLPVELGGYGASLVQLFDLLIELGAAESNLPQALRLHFHRVDHLLNAKLGLQRRIWLDRVARGDLFGNATTEAPGGEIGKVATRVTAHADGTFRLSGRKAYGTGSLYAQLIPVEAVDEDGDRLTAIVPADRAGVTLVDDWGGFGQRLTATGSSSFDDVIVQPDEILRAPKQLTRVGGNFPQLVHLATLAGIAAAAARDARDKVAARQRIYSTGSGDLARHDPLIQAEIGKIAAAASAARAIVLGAAKSLDDAFAHWADDGAGAPTTEQAYVDADITISSAQVVLVPLVLNATTQLFDALGASAIDAKSALDRHWRNARAVSSHNPWVYKARRVGDYHLNQTLPPIFVPGHDVGVSPAATVPSTIDAAVA